jgi:hypothetical protein
MLERNGIGEVRVVDACVYVCVSACVLSASVCVGSMTKEGRAGLLVCCCLVGGREIVGGGIRIKISRTSKIQGLR